MIRFLCGFFFSSIRFVKNKMVAFHTRDCWSSMISLINRHRMVSHCKIMGTTASDFAPSWNVGFPVLLKVFFFLFFWVGKKMVPPVTARMGITWTCHQYRTFKQMINQCGIIGCALDHCRPKLWSSGDQDLKDLVFVTRVHYVECTCLISLMTDIHPRRHRVSWKKIIHVTFRRVVQSPS